MKPFFRIATGKWLVSALVALLAYQSAQAQVDNYAFAASNRAYVPLTGGTSVPAILADDAISGAIPIGFTFAFDGTPYTSLRASSNGFLSFNAAATNNLTNELDNGGFTPNDTERPLIAALWDDIDGGEPGASSQASYSTTGTAPNRVFTFEWYQWAWNYTATTAVISMQVKLYEGNNRVEMLYRPETGAPVTPSASIGLAGVGTGANSFLSVSNLIANPSVSSITESDMIGIAPISGQVYAFTPPVPSPCPTPRNLTSTINGTTATVSWTVVSGGGTFSVIYGPSGFDPATGGTTLGPITGNTTTITGLVPGSYQFYVRQNCGGTAGNSNLSNAGGFSVPCPSPGPPVAGTITNTTAAISWAASLTPGGSFTVFYGPSGFTPGSTTGTAVTGITGTSTTLTNLSANTTYDIYVRQLCLGGGTGTTTAGPLTITTTLTAPNNDEPCGAVALGSGTVTGSTVGATTSVQNGISLPGCAPAQSPKDVWYSFVATGSTASLTVTGTAIGMLRAFSSPDCAAGLFNQVFCQAATGSGVGFNAPVSVTGLTAGQRYYVALSGYGSSEPSGSFTLRGTQLATHATAETAALRVYPNPSNTGQLTLRREASSAGQATLFNALGQAVRTAVLAAGSVEHSLTTTGLAAGLYTLRVSSNGETLTRKVVLQ